MVCKEDKGYMIAIVIMMVLTLTLLTTTIFLLYVSTKRSSQLLKEVMRRELSRFLYGRDDIDDSESRGIALTRVKMDAPKTGSVSSALRTLSKTPGMYFTTEHGYNRLDIDEEISSSGQGRNSYASKVLIV